jgi:hypothetical protein
MATATLDRTAKTPNAGQTRKARPGAPTTFRLLLSIGGTAYWVRPITSAIHARAFRLRRIDGKAEYHVTQDEDGHQCDCGDHVWRHEGNGTACKHVRAMRAARMLDAPASTEGTAP